MRKIVFFLKHKFIYSLFLSLILLFSCSNPSSDSRSPEDGKTVEILKKLADRVEILSDGEDLRDKSYVSFYFKQPIDHKDESKGTFKQYCRLHYKGKANITVLQTNGYSISDEEHYQMDDICDIFNTNYLEVEHRYFRHSKIDLPCDYTQAAYWDYNKAEQSTADLHEIVTAFRDLEDFEGKWISTGTSKNGILTSLYACFYPNEVDIYVPFCAPFFTEQESLSVGKYMYESCGSENSTGDGKTVNYYAWEGLRQFLGNQVAKDAVYEYFKNVKPELKDKDEKYIRPAIVALYTDSLFTLFSYKNVRRWSDVIPLYENFADNKNKDIYPECFYLFATIETNNIDKNCKKIRELINPDTGQRQSFTQERYLQKVLPDEKEEDIYCIQAAMELGYFLYVYPDFVEKGLLTEEDIKTLNKDTSITAYNQLYNVKYYGGALTQKFFNFLSENASKTKCKMVFVYGKNDVWTGAEIPETYVDDENIIKLKIKDGIHSSYLNSEEEYLPEEKDRVVSAISAFLK